MKVLLINPPLQSANPHEPLPFPLGIGYLAASVRRSGHQVAILDASLGPVRKEGNGQHYIGITLAEILDYVGKWLPDVVGISVPFTSRLKIVVEIATALQRKFPQLPLLAGGMHATIDPAILLRSGFEAVLLGEADLSLPQYLANRGSLPTSPPLEDGLAFFTSDGQLEIRPQTRHPTDLDSLPFPARDLVPFEAYIRRSGGRMIRPGARVASLQTSRGCPYRCTYCSAFQISGRKHRRRSAESVLAEIRELIDRYHVQVIAFEDDNLTADRKRALSIFEGIAHNFPGLQWMAPNGIYISHLDRELLQVMKRSGCKSLNLAFESGDPFILHQVMKKKIDPEAGRQAREWCRELGIKVNGCFILGMPGETRESMQRTKDFALSLDLDGIGIFIATPFPGTELYDICREKGYLDPEYLHGNALFQSDPEVLHRPLIETPQLKREDLLSFYAQFEREFMRQYFSRHPSAYLKKIAKNALLKIGWGK